jgi:hypothetical protein
MKNIKNTLIPINQIPPETLAHIATFFPKERDLIKAGDCGLSALANSIFSLPQIMAQHWRYLIGDENVYQAIQIYSTRCQPLIPIVRRAYHPLYLPIGWFKCTFGQIVEF